MTLIGEALVRVRPDTSTFRLETQTGVNAALTGLGVGGAASSALRSAGILGGLTALAVGAREAIGGAASLEQQLNVLEVTAAASAEEMEAIGAEAVALGADLQLPAVSSSDAAAAMLELTRGGLDVQDTIEGARGALQLATAANIGFADSAQIVARALTTFRQPGSEAANVANLLVGAANAATGEVSDMALALQQSGAVAAQAGLSIDETVTAISLLAKNGLIGSDAGTSLRTSLLRLIPQTAEAAEVVEALGVNIEDAAGNIRPLGDIFEQYRVSLQSLTGVQRQQALETIFGTDAIRAAAIFSQEGAAGFDLMADAVSRQGQAAETAAARAEGLSGAVSGLGSQLETLATTVGEFALPALEGLAEGASDVVGDVNKAIEDLKIAIAEAKRLGVDLGDKPIIEDDTFGGTFDVTLGDLKQDAEDIAGFFQTGFAAAFPAAARVREVKDAVLEVADALVETGQEAAAIDFAETFDFSAVSLLTQNAGAIAAEGLGPESALAEHLQLQAHRTGQAAGKALAEGMGDGIISAEQEAVNDARRMLTRVREEGRRQIAESIQEGRELVSQAIRQGAEAVRLSAIDARVNLISLGQGLASDAVRLLEEGPLARRIDQLRLSLDRSQSRNERRGLSEDLRDAERALRSAEANVEVSGDLTLAQRAAQQRFLEPFRRDVRDAKAALEEFTTESVIGKLEAQAEEQKRVVQQGIADLIVQFNQGGIELSTLNVRIAALLQRNGVEPYGQAGKRLGLAVRTEFLAQLRAMMEQAREIARGFQVPQIGLEPRVVSPTQVQRQAGETVAEARARAAEQERQARETAAQREQSARDLLRRAQNNLRRATDENTEATTDLARAIRAQLGSNRPSTASGRRGDDATTGIQR